MILVFALYFCYQGTEGTPDSLIYAFIFFVVRVWLGRKQHVEIDDRLALHAAVRTKIFGADGGPIRWENGECTLDTESFRYSSDTEAFEIPLAKLPALAFSCGEEFELYHENELRYFYPTEEPNQVARWALAVDLMTDRRKRTNSEIE